MAESLNLPPEVRPLWIEGLFTSEFERDTLPLLFASDKVYNEYYDAIRSKNSSMSIAIDQIKERNTLARMERQEGMWMECVDSLLYCANLRKAIFAETDFQYLAAQKHHIMSLLNFATFFLRESNIAKTKEAMLMRSYELFKKAEEAVAHVRNREDRCFLKTAIENNYSVYFAKRKKYCAAAQRIQLAVRAWAPLKLQDHRFYFAVQRSSGDLWSGRVDDAILGLKQAMAMLSKSKLEKLHSPPRQRGDHELSADTDSSSDDEPVAAAPEAHHAPFRYTIHVVNSGLDATAAASIAVHHNLAIALIAQRRYREAIGWVAKTLELAAAQSSLLAPSHPMVITIRHAQAFCEKMAVGTKMTAFKMKRDDHSSEQYRNMQVAVREVCSASGRRQAGDGDDAEEAKRSRTSPSPPQSRGRSAQAPRFRKPSHVEALQTYLRNVSYRQLVEDYGFEDPRKARSPKPSTSSGKRASPQSSSDGPGKPIVEPLHSAASSPAKQRSENVSQQSSPAKSNAHPASARSAVTARSRSPSTSPRSSQTSSRASSRASSPSPTPRGPAKVEFSPPAEATVQSADSVVEAHPETKQSASQDSASPPMETKQAPVEEQQETTPLVTEAAAADSAAANPHDDHHNTTTYGNDEFDSASELASPVKNDQPVENDDRPETEAPPLSYDAEPVASEAPRADSNNNDEAPIESQQVAPQQPEQMAATSLAVETERNENRPRGDDAYADDGFDAMSAPSSPEKRAQENDSDPVAPPPVAPAPTELAAADTTYGDEGFEETSINGHANDQKHPHDSTYADDGFESEAVSPEKKKIPPHSEAPAPDAPEPAEGNAAREDADYTNDFETTVASAAPAESAAGGNDATYGEDTFEES